MICKVGITKRIFKNGSNQKEPAQQDADNAPAIADSTAISTWITFFQSMTHH